MTKKLILETLDDVKCLARALCIQLQILVCDLRLLQLKSQRFFLNRKIDVEVCKVSRGYCGGFQAAAVPINDDAV